MSNDLLGNLPPALDVAREIYEIARRGRRLKALYRVLRTIESEQDDDQRDRLADPSSAQQAEVRK